MKVLKISYYLIAVLMTMWFLLSWFEIGFHDFTRPDPVYHAWNLFVLLF